MKVTQPRVSYSDLCAWPEDGRRYELYDGEAFVVPSPLLLHQIVAQNLYLLFRDWATAHRGLAAMPPLDIVLSEYDVVQPDLVVFGPEKTRRLNAHQVIRIPPDLAVEVLSPSTAKTDRGKKMQLLARFGVPEYWIVDPEERQVEIYTLAPGGFTLHATCGEPGTLGAATLSDFACSAQDVFRNPLAD